MEELIRILFKWLKPILLVCVIAAIGSAIVSMMLKEQFTSSVLFQVSNPYMMDRGNLFSEEMKGPVYLFGGKDDVNRMVTLSSSREIHSKLINKFNLYEQYKIEKNDPQSAHWMALAIDGHLKVTKTKEGMIRAEVMDENPQLAADMANYVVKQLDSLNKEIITEKKKGLLDLYNREIEDRKKSVGFFMDSLQRYAQKKPEDTVMIGIISNLAEDALEQHQKVATIAKEHSAALNQPFSSIYMIEEAVPAVKRTKPVRWLIVASATLCSLLAMVFMAVFVEKFKEFKLD